MRKTALNKSCVKHKMYCDFDQKPCIMLKNNHVMEENLNHFQIPSTVKIWRINVKQNLINRELSTLWVISI